MKIEIRADSVVLEGYVNVTGRDSRTLYDAAGPFIEQVTPGAFGKALERGENVELRFDHGSDVYGGTGDGTLTLQEDNIGLRARATVTDPKIREKAEKRELRGWSFGFIATEQRWDNEAQPRRRYVDALELREVSILDVTPAYIATSIEARDGEARLVEYREADMTTPDYTTQTVTDTHETTIETTPDGETEREMISRRIEVWKWKRRDSPAERGNA